MSPTPRIDRARLKKLMAQLNAQVVEWPYMQLHDQPLLIETKKQSLSVADLFTTDQKVADDPTKATAALKRLLQPFEEDKLFLDLMKEDAIYEIQETANIYIPELNKHEKTVRKIADHLRRLTGYVNDENTPLSLIENEVAALRKNFTTLKNIIKGREESGYTAPTKLTGLEHSEIEEDPTFASLVKATQASSLILATTLGELQVQLDKIFPPPARGRQ